MSTDDFLDKAFQDDVEDGDILYILGIASILSIRDGIKHFFTDNTPLTTLEDLIG